MIKEEQFKAEIDSIVQQLVRVYKPKKILLFGSLVQGKVSAGTDIDLFIIKQDVPYFGIERVRQLERMIKYRLATDFIVYKPEEVQERLKLGDHFIKNIFKEGKVLYES